MFVTKWPYEESAIDGDEEWTSLTSAHSFVWFSLVFTFKKNFIEGLTHVKYHED